MSWGSPCQVPLTVVHVAPTARAQVHRETAAAWQAFAVWATWFDYRPDNATTGGYNCRDKQGTGASGWSNHAFGIAIDANWTANPVGAFPGDYPAGMVEALEGVRTVGGATVFEWGGRWRTVDVMHWEVACTASELAAGFDVATVPVDTLETVTGRSERRIGAVQRLLRLDLSLIHI